MQQYKVLSVTTGKEILQADLDKIPGDKRFTVQLTEEGRKVNDAYRAEYRRRRKSSN